MAVRFSRTCLYCEMEYILIVTDAGYNAWCAGAFVQNAFPELSAGDRELLATGCCGTCFDDMWMEDDLDEFEIWDDE